MHTFKVVTREVPHCGNQITADVVRSDGKVVRSGMWPDYAHADCALLNEYVLQGWTAEQYHVARSAKMRSLRSQDRKL